MEAKVTQRQVQIVESADQRTGRMKIYCISRVGLRNLWEYKGRCFFSLGWTLKAPSSHQMALLGADGNDQRMVELDLIATK